MSRGRTRRTASPPPEEDQDGDERAAFIASLELRRTIRQSHAILELAEESCDRNYEEFVSSLPAFTSSTPRPFSERIERELAQLAQRNPNPDPIEGPRLYYEWISLRRQVTNLTQGLRELEAGNQQMALQLQNRR
jgi:hypothetical protein